jgi:hypothetical protein
LAGVGPLTKEIMNLEQQRARAQQLCAEAGVSVLPYGNAWWLLGHGINRVVGELAGLSHCDLRRHPAFRR